MCENVKVPFESGLKSPLSKDEENLYFTKNLLPLVTWIPLVSEIMTFSVSLSKNQVV